MVNSKHKKIEYDSINHKENDNKRGISPFNTLRNIMRSNGGVSIGEDNYPLFRYLYQQYRLSIILTNSVASRIPSTIPATNEAQFKPP